MTALIQRLIELRTLEQRHSDLLTKRADVARQRDAADGEVITAQRALNEAVTLHAIDEVPKSRVDALQEAFRDASTRARGLASADPILYERIREAQQAVSLARAAAAQEACIEHAAKVKTARERVRRMARDFALALQDFTRIEAASRSGDIMTGPALMELAGDPVAVMASHGVTPLQHYFLVTRGTDQLTTDELIEIAGGEPKAAE